MYPEEPLPQCIHLLLFMNLLKDLAFSLAQHFLYSKCYNRFALTSRIVICLFLIINEGIFLRFQGVKGKGMYYVEKAARLLIILTPLLNICFFLNVELPVYSDSAIFHGIFCFRMSEFLLQNMIMIKLQATSNYARIGFLAVLLDSLLALTKYNNFTDSIILAIETIFVQAFLELFFVGVALLSERSQRILNLIKEGVLIITEKSKGQAHIEFYNEKLMDFLQIPKDQSFLASFESRLKDFELQKVKSKEELFPCFSIPMSKIDEQPVCFSSLKDIFAHFQKNSKNKDFFLILEQRARLQTKSRRLKLVIRREFFPGKKTYIFSLRSIEQRLRLKENLEAKHRLLSSFTHELKTPLNGSIPILEELRAKLLETKTAVYLERAIASLKLMENSLNNIIDYSLALSDQFIVHLARINLLELLGEVFSIIRSKIELKNLQFTIDLDGDLEDSLVLTTDYNRLKQVILNILLNSIQFTENGFINLSMLKISDKPLTIRIKIEDSGIGMTEESVEKLRKRFSEGEKSEVQMNSTGFCLGLIMSQRIAVLLGSSGVEIYSAFNEGTTVEFSIVDQNLKKDENPSVPSKEQEITDVRVTHRKLSFATQNRRIIQSSQFLQSIISKNIALQKNFKESLNNPQGVSLVLSERNEEFSNVEMQTDKKVAMYDFTNNHVQECDSPNKEMSQMSPVKQQRNHKTFIRFTHYHTCTSIKAITI